MNIVASGVRLVAWLSLGLARVCLRLTRAAFDLADAIDGAL